MNIAYGVKNEIQSFHATSASTETWPSEEEKRRKKSASLPNSLTSSKVIDANFDEKGQLTFMKQTDDFHYAEGDRKAQSDVATFQNDTNVMNLERMPGFPTRRDDDRRYDPHRRGDGRLRCARARLHDAAAGRREGGIGMLDKGEPTLGRRTA